MNKESANAWSRVRKTTKGRYTVRRIALLKAIIRDTLTKKTSLRLIFDKKHRLGDWTKSYLKETTGQFDQNVEVL